MATSLDTCSRSAACGEASVVANTACGEASVEDKLMRSERLRIVDNELRRLDPLWQEILLLRDVEGMAYEQIGEALELSPGTVKSRLHRARNELRKRVQRYLASNNLAKGPGDDRS